MTRAGTGLAVALTALAIAMAVSAVRSRTSRGTAAGAGPAGAAYVGRGRCAACHETEARLWSGSDHDLAMQEANDRTVLGDFDSATVTYRGITSTFFRRGGAFFVRTEGPDGRLADFPIAYVLGVRPLQQYLVPFPGGRYQVLSLAWDARPASAGGQRWFPLYPGAAIDARSPLHWTRPSQNWNTVCAECHSTGLEKGFDVASSTYRTTWSEIDVSCEACHGPGSRHVAIAEEESTPSRAMSRTVRSGAPRDWGLVANPGESRRTWTLRPGALTATPGVAPGRPARPHVEIEACAPCHARRSSLAAGYVAGDTLLDYYRVSLLREGLYHPDGQIDDEVYVYGSFVQSRMYAAGVTCSDCHDPHSLKTRAAGNALCTRCHAAGRYDRPSHHFHEPSSAGARCVECHMPSKTYMVVDPRRDHSLRIPRPDLSVDIGVPNACNGCHTDRSARWAADAVERWYGPREGPPHFAVAIHGGRARDPAAVAPLEALARDTTRPAIVRATAFSLLAGYRRASIAAALRVGLADPEPLVRLGALEGIGGIDGTGGLDAAAVLALAYPLLKDPVTAVRVRAARLLVAVPRALMTPEQAAAVARGAGEYERVQRVNEDHAGSWDNLGDLYTLQGRADDAEAAYRTALALDSTDVVAPLNLADLLRALGRDDLGEQVLRRALAVNPGAPELLHAIGLLRVRQGDVGGALDRLGRAAAGRPDNPRFAYVYGVALASHGEVARGVRVLADALRAHPYDADLLAALATYNRDLGRTEAAIRYAERLVEVIPEDGEARALLAQVGGVRR